jgi:signal peptidase II
MKKDYLKLLLLITLFIFLDQVIKLLISGWYTHTQFNIIGGILYFKPVLNTKLSWINSWFNLGISFIAHVLFNLFIIFIVIYVFKYCKTKYRIDKQIYFTFIFFLSGAFCSLIDKIFWGGSLDYIGIKGFFIFDLKDIYISISEMLLIIYFITYIIKNPEILKTNYKRDMLEIKEFIKFVRKDIFRT